MKTPDITVLDPETKLQKSPEFRIKKKILFVTTSYPRFKGDIAGSFFIPLLDRLQKDFDITILAPDDIKVNLDSKNVKRFKYFIPRSLQKFAYNKGIPENLAANKLLLLQFPFFFISMLIAIIRYSTTVDVIITNWMLPAGLAGSVVSMFTCRKHIIIEHSAGLHYLFNSPFKDIIINFILNNTWKLVAVSPYQIDMLRPYLEKHNVEYEVIPMGIDTNQYNLEMDLSQYRKELNIPEKNKTILFMGRLADIKGLDILINSVAGISNITLIVAGDKTDTIKYHKLCEKLNVDTRFIGLVTGIEKIKLIKMVDIVAVPSRKMKNNRVEGSPLIVMEALAAGKIIIASATGGISCMIENNINGLLFDPENVEQLKSLIYKVIDNQDFYYTLSEEAKKSGASYDINIVAQRFIRLIGKEEPR